MSFRMITFKRLLSSQKCFNITQVRDCSNKEQFSRSSRKLDGGASWSNFAKDLFCIWSSLIHLPREIKQS